MNNHKIIDTDQLRKNKFTFSGLSEKTKNQLIAGGLSFAGIATAVGLSKLFSSEDSLNFIPSTKAPEVKDVTASALNEPNETPSDFETSSVAEEIVEVSELENAEVYEEEAYEDSVTYEVEYTVSFDSEASFANGVHDGMDFSSAFAQAREEVGMGGFFNWNSNTYSTYTKEEWEAMSYEDQQRFYNDVSEQSQLDVNSWTVESSDTYDSHSNNEEVIETIDTSEVEIMDDNTSASSDDISNDGVETITIVPPAAYGTGDINADNIVDAIVIDNNNDGKADLLALDEDYDGTFESFLINEDGDEDLDVFIIDEGVDGIDDGDTIEEISDIVDMEDFIVIDEDDDVLEDMDFIDDLIDINDGDDGEEDNSTSDLGFEDPGL